MAVSQSTPPLLGDIRGSTDDGRVIGMWSYALDGITPTPIHSLRVESWANLETHGQGARAVRGAWDYGLF